MLFPHLAKAKLQTNRTPTFYKAHWFREDHNVKHGSRQEQRKLAKESQDNTPLHGLPYMVMPIFKPGTHHAIFVVCWTQRRRKDDCCMVCAHQRQLSPVDFTNATVVGPIRKTNRSNNCCMVCAGLKTSVASTDRPQTNHSETFP